MSGAVDKWHEASKKVSVFHQLSGGAAADKAAETARLAKKSSGAMDPNTLLPKRMAKGGSTSSASSRADGIAQRGKTRGTMLCSGGMAKGKK